MKASDVITRARDILQDAGADYWTADELLRWLNDSRLDAYKLRPDLYEATEDVTLVEGGRQQLPSDSKFLFAVRRNVSASKQRAITLVSGPVLDRIRPNWRSQAPAREIQHYLYDQRDPGHFDVFPPARADVTVQISYAKPPEPISEPDTTDLVQEGVYATACVDYVLYRAFLKEADTVPAFHGRALQHLTMAQATLTGDIPTKASAGPNQG
ncbi:hypothetical protein RE432_14840 [Pusillimonas sp. SM2304]|uniref:phage adaptor protein n=1 Tax=Pusillimonas sp. SM2304 TaxID=3073241 RepID=UPI002876682A|nr:DUF6682 family protein [Pusillimonas sp. SM2304]MDS1141716.1 hypothetical protein [Pusillimonas sp. SM2304]